MAKPTNLLSPMLGLGALVCTLLTSSPMRAAQPMTLKEAEAALDKCNRLTVGMSLEEAQAVTGEALQFFADNRLSVHPNCVVFTSQTGRIAGIWTRFWLSTEYRTLRDMYIDLMRGLPLCFTWPLTVETHARVPTERFSATRPIDAGDSIVASMNRLRLGEDVDKVRGTFNLSAIPHDGDGFSVQ